MVNTGFSPVTHGFHFSNNNIKWSFKQLPIIQGTALCGGMVYAALDYFLGHMTIPVDKTAPVEGATLHDYIYNRQMDAHRNTAGRFIGSSIPIFGPLMSNVVIDSAAEYNKLRSILQRGNPIPLCMVGGHGAGFGHHLLAIGCNDTGPLSISAYDPNAPHTVATITQRGDQDFRNTQSSHSFRAIFVDDGYQRATPPVLAGQANWRWCRKCQGLFYFGNPTNGACPAGGSHDVVGSGNYVLSIHVGSGQPDWRWCSKCEGLYFAGNAGSAGICPAGGIHNGITSGNYFLALGTGTGQQNWRWCRVCEGLFFAGNNSLGVCPANPNGHDGSRSGNYFLPTTTA